MPSRLSRSRAFWNLRAEQVMDQVFSHGDTTLQALPSVLSSRAANTEKNQRDHRPQRPWLIGSSLVALAGISASFWLAHNWQRSVQALNRERDLQMVERLRRMPVASTDTTAAATEPRPTNDTTTDAATTNADVVADATPTLEPLTLPLAGPLPLADTSLSDEAIAASLPAEPLLVGVVHAGGGQGSAIFQLDQLSLSAAPGEAIGNSGWRLKTVQANGAVIEREGVERSLSVGGAF